MHSQLQTVTGNNISYEDFVMCVVAKVGPEYDSVDTNITLM